MVGFIQRRINRRLVDATDAGDIKTVSDAIVYGSADLNTKAKEGKTALHCAANKGFTEIARMLIDNGADVYVKNEDGMTALNYADKQGHTEIVKLLRDNEASG